MAGNVDYQVIKMCGISESKVISTVSDYLKSNEDCLITVESLYGDIRLKVTSKVSDEKESKKILKAATKAIKEKFSEKIYTTSEEKSLEGVVVDLIKANKLSVSTAESCTGGLLCARLVNVSGVSEVLKSGVITYSNKAKHKMLGVKNRTLDKFGAVSQETAREMAKGAASNLKTEVSAAITGIAGPEGGTGDKPVGLVYIAVNVCGDIKVKEYHFEGDRTAVRECSVVAALSLMRRQILEYYSKVTFGK